MTTTPTSPLSTPPSPRPPAGGASAGPAELPALRPAIPAGFLDALPEEVVTHALVRDIALPGGAGTLALITLDNGKDHTRPTTFGPRGLAELATALDLITERVHRGELAGVAVTGKPFIFAVGADLGMVTAGHERSQAVDVGRVGHDVFGRLGELPVPTFAFVNGAAMGGGLELALHCDYRTLSRGARAVALPECFLGLIPGWGGSYLLPRLIGPQRAVQVILANPLSNNRMLGAEQAFELGIADRLFDPADFLEESLAWAAEVISGRVTVQRAPVPQDEATWTAVLAQARELVDTKLHGAAPAPYRALDLIALARTADRATAFEAETEALADLALGDELRAGLYAFDLVTKRAKRPAGAPSPALARPITAVGVVGAGLMAGQLALLFARRLQVPVVMTDLDAERVERGVGAVHAEIGKLAAKGRISPDAANRLRALVTGSTETAAFAGSDLVIEAVFEDLAVKQQVLAQVEAVVGPECVLMTNTSSLSITAMASQLAHPERVVGFHFFNPVAVMPLLEVIRGERTDEVTLATAFAVAKQLKKSAVGVKDAPGFVVNRLLIRLLGEVTAALDEGTPAEVADRALAPLGLPMSPFTLLQLVGPGVALHVSQILHDAFPQRFPEPATLRRLVAAGKTAIWSWDAEGNPCIDDDTRALLSSGDRAGTEAEVLERTLRAVALEAGTMLDEGVVAQAEDLDLCMILGAGWPFHLGGITPYLDRTGVSEQVLGRRLLPPGRADVPRG